MRGEARKDHVEGKLDPNWEGLFRIIATLQNCAYWLEEFVGKIILRTKNATHLNSYFNKKTRNHNLFPTLGSPPPPSKTIIGFGWKVFNEAHLGHIVKGKYYRYNHIMKSFYTGHPISFIFIVYFFLCLFILYLN